MTRRPRGSLRVAAAAPHHELRSAFRAAWLVGLLLLLAGCGTLEFLDPGRCVEPTGPIELALANFRVSQTNQTRDNAIPLLSGSAAGVRVAIETSVTRPTLSDVTIEVDAVGPEGERTTVVRESFTCVRPTTLAEAHLRGSRMVEERAYELRVLDGAGALRIEASVQPRLLEAEPYTLLLVPMRVNGVEASTDSERLAAWSEEAFAMFPLEREAVLLATLDVGTIDAPPGREGGLVLLHALTEHTRELGEMGLLPPLSVVIGLMPRDGGWWGFNSCRCMSLNL